jgi:hypothetical protein
MKRSPSLNSARSPDQHEQIEGGSHEPTGHKALLMCCKKKSTAYVLLFILGNAKSSVYIWLFGCVQGLFSTQTFGNQSTQILFL